MSNSGSLMKRVVVFAMALFLSASAFFYAPIEAVASENHNISVSSSFDDYEVLSASEAEAFSVDISQHIVNHNFYYYDGVVDFGHLDFGSDFISDELYSVDISFNLEVVTNYLVRARYFGLYDIYGQNVIPNTSIPYGSDLVFFYGRLPNYSDGDSGGIPGYVNKFIYRSNLVLTGEQLLNNHVNLGLVYLTDSVYSSIYSKFSLDYTVNSITVLTGEESASYESGYTAGESAGYESGYSTGESAGYSSGYETGYEQGESAGYDQGFQAGVDSVDTQSYYDAGYSAGYSAGYNVGYEEGYNLGYEEGYDQGYADCLARLQESGADTGEYPKILYSDRFGHTFQTNITYAIPFSYRDSVKGYLGNIDFDPNHTYKFNVGINPYNWDTDGTISYEDEFYFDIGGIEYPLFYSFINPSTYVTSIYVPGDRLSDSYYLVWNTIRAAQSGGANSIISVVCPYSVAVYDMGSRNDSQNQIANQTDTLIHGFNDSGGTSMNDSFNTSINDYNIAEDSLFNAVNTGLDDFEFFDFESVPAMVTGITFVTSIMDSLFNAMGGASGAGIVLSVLFTIVIVSMALGLARFYQSDGRKGRKE